MCWPTCGSWIIERGNLRVYAWLRVKTKVKSTGVHNVLSWSLNHRTRKFIMSWLRVKIKAKGTGVRSFLSWILHHRTRQFQSYVVATRLSTDHRTRNIERGNLLCTGYASTRSYA